MLAHAHKLGDRLLHEVHYGPWKRHVFSRANFALTRGVSGICLVASVADSRRTIIGGNSFYPPILLNVKGRMLLALSLTGDSHWLTGCLKSKLQWVLKESHRNTALEFFAGD